jgi:hypothetical protein
LLTFEDIAPGKFTSYQGFMWSTGYVADVTDFSWIPGLAHSAVSGTHVFAPPLRGSNGFSSATAFSLNSGYFTAYNGSDYPLTVTAYLNGIFMGSQSFTLTDKEPTFLTFDQALFGTITEVKFSNYSGIESTGNLLAFDDLTVNADAAGDVPEPASIALLGLGLLGLACVRRLRKA